MIGEAYQVLSDCPYCQVEAAVVELMDPLHPACHLGVPAHTRCRLCGWRVVASEEAFAPKMPLAAGRCPACHKHLDEAARAGDGPCPHCGYRPTAEVDRDPADYSNPELAAKLLDRWATEEGETDTETFCLSNMGMGKTDVVALLVSKQVVPTTFDVIAFLFPGSMGGTGGAPLEEQRPTEVVDRAPEIPPPGPQERNARADSPDPLDPLIPVRALISVMVADGELRAGERKFIARFLEGEGLPPVQESDLRIWRPQELGVPADPAARESVLEAMIHLMHLDRERDGSEWKVIQAFARFWGLSDEALAALDKRYDRRYATLMTRLWRTLSSFVRIH